MNKKILIIVICNFIINQISSQQSAIDLINNSIAFHDPQQNWEKLQANLYFTIERAESPNGRRKVYIDNK